MERLRRDILMDLATDAYWAGVNGHSTETLETRVDLALEMVDPLSDRITVFSNHLDLIEYLNEAEAGYTGE